MEMTEENFVDFKCPYCGALNSFPASAARLTRQCMNCLEAFLVPAKGEETARKLPLPVEAQKIRLRRFQPEDWKDLLEFEYDDENEATDWLHRIAQTRFAEPRQLFSVAVESRSSGKVIGALGLTFIDPALNQMEISLSFNKDTGFKGLDREALEAALDFCFQELNLHRVVAECGAEDTERRHLYEQIGMRQEAEFKKHQQMNGEWLNTTWFAILEEEYFNDAPAAGGQTS